MRCREVTLTGRAPSLCLQISAPGRAVPATLFEGPEVCLMLLSGCAADCLPHGGTFHLQPHQVTRIIAGIAAARLLLRQTRSIAWCADALLPEGS